MKPTLKAQSPRDRIKAPWLGLSVVVRHEQWGPVGKESSGSPGQRLPLCLSAAVCCQETLRQGIFNKLTKMTFYGQFVAGEDQESIQSPIWQNRAFGVGSILDYGVEGDLSPKEAEHKEME